MLNKPWYAFRPTQIVRRMRLHGGEQEVALPWGARMVLDPGESVGSSIARTGVYELAVSEVIARLAAAGELAVDVGANIGYISSLLAWRVGPQGRVVAFEPNPPVADRLQRNANDNVTVHRSAVSSAPGSSILVVPEGFERNQGTATLEAAGEGVAVETTSLDAELGAATVGVLKIDVEGHEPAVLDGAESLLSEGRVRDIVFEEHAYPSEVSRRLSEHGYRLFGLRQSFWGVEIVEPEHERTLWDAPTYLATRDPDRALARCGRGWLVLTPRLERFLRRA